MQEDGGNSLFDFVVKAHKLIEHGELEISEWLQVVKIIFKQMIEITDYIHSKNVCHMDISLENWLINDMRVALESTESGKKIRFDIDGIQIKLCDFGCVFIHI